MHLMFGVPEHVPNEIEKDGNISENEIEKDGNMIENAHD